MGCIVSRSTTKPLDIQKKSIHTVSQVIGKLINNRLLASKSNLHFLRGSVLEYFAPQSLIHG